MSPSLVHLCTRFFTTYEPISGPDQIQEKGVVDRKFEMKKTINRETAPLKKSDSQPPILRSLLKQTREPECCPHPNCGSHDLRKRGFKKKKREVLQRYECKKCGSIFTGQRQKGRQYPLKVVLDSIKRFYLGVPSRSLAAAIAKELGEPFSRATLFSWIKSYEHLCRFARLRAEAVSRFSLEAMILKETFQHRQIYKFAYHRAKTTIIVESQEHASLLPLAEFLEKVPETTSNRIFLRKEKRASRTGRGDEFTGLFVQRKKNFATEITGLVIESVRENKKRHELLQEFMLATDSVTVAIEVPVILRHGRNQNRETTTGHIDILQIRNGYLHVLDYKPNAAKEKPFNQLLTYALAIEQMTGIALERMKCAWFDEHDYFEFSPAEALRRQARSMEPDHRVT